MNLVSALRRVHGLARRLVRRAARVLQVGRRGRRSGRAVRRAAGKPAALVLVEVSAPFLSRDALIEVSAPSRDTDRSSRIRFCSFSDDAVPARPPRPEAFVYLKQRSS